MSIKDKELRNAMLKRNQEKEDQDFKYKLEQMAQTEKEMNIRRKELKNKKNQEIQDYYQNHIYSKKEAERLERERDRKYLQMGIDKLEKEENDRMNFFKKIKSGYKQNHEVHRKYQEFYKVY